MRRRDDLVRAARHGEVATRLSPELPGLALEAALVAVAQGRVAAARPLLEKELNARGAPPDRLDLIETVQALLACGLAERAEKAFVARFGREIRQTHGKDADVLRLATRIALEKGDLREGRACARRLLRLDPKSIVAIHNLALIAIKRRRYGVARAWIARGRAAAPADAGIRKLQTLCFVSRVAAALRLA